MATTTSSDASAHEAIRTYIDAFPEPARSRLILIRTLIREAAPEATERISYKMPAYFLNGILVYFAGYARHIGFYPGSEAIKVFEHRLAPYKHAKGSIQFPIDLDPPAELIRDIVLFRMNENTKRKGKTRKGVAIS